jgi:erythromycin esterase-like protein
MAGTLERLIAHLEERGRARTVVWAHNSHVGDARRTSMGLRGEHNIGQLARERYGLGAVLIGFTTCTGTVSAASDWGAAVERKRVRPPREDSVEAVFGAVDRDAFWLRLRDDGRAAEELFHPRLERAIGVIYRPENELASHYFETHLSEQFDYVIHFDVTRAVEPLERTAEWQQGEPPETYPTAL